MRDLCISFTSLCFLFPVRGRVKSLRTGRGLKNFRTGGVFVCVCVCVCVCGGGGGQYPIICHGSLRQGFELALTAFLNI